MAPNNKVSPLEALQANKADLPPLATYSDAVAAAGGKGPAIDTTRRHKAELKSFFKELALYLVWVGCFSMSIFLSRDNTQMFFYTAMFKDVFITNDFQMQVDIGDADGFWEWAAETMDSLLGGDYISEDFTSTGNVTGNFLYGNRMLGNVRMRQVRVAGEACPKLYQNLEETPTCYPAWSVISEETAYTKEWDPDFDTSSEYFTWKSVTETDELLAFFGQFGTYPGSGYVVDFPDDQENATAILTSLQENKWTDVKTRAVFLDFAFYNPNLDLFMAVRIVNEFLPSGVVELFGTFRAMKLDRYPLDSFSNYLVVGCEGITLALVFFYFFEEVIQIYKEGVRSYFSDFWNFMDIMNLVLFMAVAYLRLNTHFRVEEMFGNPDNITAPKLQNIAFWFDQEKALIGVNAILMYVKVMKYLTATKKFSRVTRTIARGFGDLVAFFILFFIAILGFAFGGLLIMGTDQEEYYKLELGIATLIRASFGDFDYDATREAHRVLGPVFFFMWLVFAGVILLNMAIAIISEAFLAVMNEDAENEGEKTMFDAINQFALVKRVKNLIEDREAVEELENAIDDIDADNDAMVDEGELKEFLDNNKDAKKVFGVSSANELMSKFDSDGSGQLDEEELQELKSYLKQKKEEYDEKIEEEKSAAPSARGGIPGDDTDINALLGLASPAAAGGKVGGGGVGVSEEKFKELENKLNYISDKVDLVLAKLDGLQAGGGVMPGGAGGMGNKTPRLAGRSGSRFAGPLAATHDGAASTSESAADTSSPYRRSIDRSKYSSSKAAAFEEF